MDKNEIDYYNQLWAGASPPEIIAWAYEKFGAELASSSSFQTQSVPLLHWIAQEAPEIPILFLDTGFHFTETLEFRDRLVRLWGLRLEVLTPEMGHQRFLEAEGELYLRDTDRCCHINKVEPLERALQGRRAWISGIRRDQTEARGAVPLISLRKDGLIKICPLAAWTSQQVADHIRSAGLPEHPLTRSGYRSIGCRPCTQPAPVGSEDRTGRWAGQEKTECGLHFCPRTHRLVRDGKSA